MRGNYPARIIDTGARIPRLLEKGRRWKLSFVGQRSRYGQKRVSDRFHRIPPNENRLIRNRPGYSSESCRQSPTGRLLSEYCSAEMQAVSPESKPSAATADEKGIAHNTTAVNRLLNFLFKSFPPLKFIYPRWNFKRFKRIYFKINCTYSRFSPYAGGSLSSTAAFILATWSGESTLSPLRSQT